MVNTAVENKMRICCETFRKGVESDPWERATVATLNEISCID